MSRQEGYMFTRQSFIQLTLVCIALLGLAACTTATPAPASAPVVEAPVESTAPTDAADAPAETVAAAETITSTEAGVEASTEVSAEATITDSVISEAPGGEQPVASPSQADAGAAAEEGSSAPQGASGETESELQEEEVQPQPGTPLVHSDSAYGFSVSYPSDYVVRTEPPEKLAGLEPQPVAAYAFLNPTIAASDVAELELPDLQLRVHSAAGAASLEEWLGSYGFLAEGNLPPEPFQTAGAPGLKVCVSTMIVPNCSYFVFGNGWVYQLVPGSAAGQAIMESFAFVA
jgi:hypothetical protein